MGKTTRLLRDRRGATAIEYGLFAGFAAIVLMSGLSSIGGRLNGTLDKAGQAMAATPAPSAETPPRTATSDASAATRTADGRYILVSETQEGFLQNHQ